MHDKKERGAREEYGGGGNREKGNERGSEMKKDEGKET